MIKSSPEVIGSVVGKMILESINQIRTELASTMKTGPRAIFNERIENELKDLLYMLTVIIVETKFGRDDTTDSINIKVLDIVYADKDFDDSAYWDSGSGYLKVTKNGDFNLNGLSKRFNKNLFDHRKVMYFDVKLMTELLRDFVDRAMELVGKYSVPGRLKV